MLLIQTKLNLLAVFHIKMLFKAFTFYNDAEIPVFATIALSPIEKVKLQNLTLSGNK